MNNKNIITPAFIFDLNKINNNLEKLKESLKELPKSQILYSLKTNNLPIIIETLSKKNVYIEVVSKEEYDYVESLKIDLSKVVLNGPIKSKEDIKKGIKNNSFINLDNLEEINNCIELKHLIKSTHYNKLGIRLNIDLKKDKMKDLIGYQNSRFGISKKEFDIAIKLLNDNNIKLNGIHIHINHNYNIINNYEEISKKIGLLIKKYKLELEYIDFGGGILRAVENINYKEAIEKIKNNISINNITIMIEPGAALTANSGIIISKVISKKEINNTSYITIDASKNYYDITNKYNKWNHYKIERLNKNNKIIKKQILCGFTCMENDRLFELSNEEEINIGDIIIIEKVGSYSINFIPFFIKGIPNIYINKENKLKLLYKNKTIMELYHENNK